MTIFRTRALPALCIALSLLCLAVSVRAADSTPTTTPVPQQLVKLETNLGDIFIRLEDKKASISAANFIQYVKAGHYDGTIFHRVIKGFMIQGGGLTPDMKQKNTRAAIRNEADNGIKNQKYTIAMARTNEPHSATSQFFINTKDNDFLDFKSQTPQGWGYAVFGKVVRGQNVVDKIEAVSTGKQGPNGDVPVTPVIIQKATIVVEQPR